MTTADCIVIGLGAYGSAAAWQLARRGAKVIGIDRFSPPHAHGSSHGATRITRLAIGEGEVYVPLAMRSHAIWAELEALDPRRSLYLPTGGLIMGPAGGGGRFHGRPDFVQRTIDAARRFGIVHEVFDGREAARRFPQFVTQGDEVAYYEPAAGVLRPEDCVRAQLEEARRNGADIRVDELVQSIEPGPDGVTVRTSRGSYEAGHAIVTAGAWLPGLLGGAYARRLRVMRQVLHWFATTEPRLYEPGRCPVFIWKHGDADGDELYGFPMVDGYPGVKVATEQFETDTQPDTVERSVGDAECRAMYEQHIDGRLRGIAADCVHTATCLYTVSPDSGFVVDGEEGSCVTVVSACSGHGFKHSAALGEQLALRALGEPCGVDWGVFSSGRFGA